MFIGLGAGFWSCLFGEGVLTFGFCFFSDQSVIAICSLVGNFLWTLWFWPLEVSGEMCFWVLGHTDILTHRNGHRIED